MIKIIMDSGKEYKLDIPMYQFRKKIENHIGILCNFLVEIDNIIINPSHISSVEIE